MRNRASSEFGADPGELGPQGRFPRSAPGGHDDQLRERRCVPCRCGSGSSSTVTTASLPVLLHGPGTRRSGLPPPSSQRTCVTRKSAYSSHEPNFPVFPAVDLERDRRNPSQPAIPERRPTGRRIFVLRDDGRPRFGLQVAQVCSRRRSGRDRPPRSPSQLRVDGLKLPPECRPAASRPS